MSRYVMAIGNSNRVVIDVPLELKRRLHAALAADGVSLRQWFVEAAERYLTRYETGQRELPMVAESREKWGAR
jgi:hypothetical protein